MHDDANRSLPATFGVRGSLLVGTQLNPGALTVADGRIAALHRGQVRDGDLPATVISADIVSPGLIDLQVNSGFGIEVGEDPAAIDRLSGALVATGVTSYLPTIVSSPAAFYPAVFDAFARVDPGAGAVPLGLHLEGPFLAPTKKGAHRLEPIMAADEALFESWLTSDTIRLVTLAPERSGAIDRIRRLREKGIVVSLGHTDSSLEAFTAGVDAGATKATHLYNAMTAIHHRAPGAMVATLTDDRVTTGLIPDGVHSHLATLRLALKAKGPDGIAVVSDMMTAAGLGPGAYHLGGQAVTVDETSARLADGTLAGSILTMDAAVRNLVEWTGTSAAIALHMATAVPARLLGLDHIGLLRVGATADLALWDRTLALQHTIVGGALRWSRRHA